MSVLKFFRNIAIILITIQAGCAVRYKIPDEIYFAGVEIPFEKYGVGERLEKIFNILVHDRRGFLQNLIDYKDDYLPYAAEVLDNYRIHPDFTYIIPVESEFNARAFSKAGASGLWQLMAATGRMYGLRVDNYVDERNLLCKSTEAAAEHLMMLSRLFDNDPFLMLAAYNNGDYNVRSTLESQETTDFWEIRSNSETESYVEKIIIYKLILDDPEKYGFKESRIKKTGKYETSTISLGPEDLSFSDICGIIGISYREFFQLNPHIKFGSYKTGGYISKYTSMEIVLPENKSEVLLAELSKNDLIVNSIETKYYIKQDKINVLVDIYEVKLNERIESIAFKYGVDWRELSAENNLEIISLPSGIETAKLYKGQKIRIIK